MNVHVDPIDPALGKFSIGQPVPRTEDPTLLRGEGRYTDDVNLPGQAYMVMVRSRHAHGVIRKIDAEAAKKMPGVLAVYTAADIKFGPMLNATPIKHRDGTPIRTRPRHALADDRVRFVGDPIACVVATSVGQAKDAAEAVEVDIEPLPAVTDEREALKPGAPLLYDEAPGNLALEFHFGDTEKTSAAFAAAAHTVKLDLVNNRIVVCAMEPRATLAEYDAANEFWTLYAPSQGSFGMRDQIAKEILKVPPDKLRVVTGNVGGSFGMKHIYPENICALHAARALARPVKWTDERSESFVSDTHGRGNMVTAELALDAQGTFLGLRLTGFTNVGAYLSRVSPLFGTLNFPKNIVSVYRTPVIEATVKVAYTNTSPMGAYRGAGRPEANYFMERLIEAAAKKMGVDALDLRRRNHITPDQLPYQTPSATKYDSGDFPAILERTLEASDWRGFDKRRSESKARGKLRGRGMSDFLEVTAPLGKELGAIKFQPDGSVMLTSGALDYGTGHATPFMQVVAQTLGIPFDKLRYRQGDTNDLIFGGGSGGSKTAMCAGTAFLMSSEKVIENGKQIAAHVLEAAPADIEFKAGKFRIVGTDRSVDLLDLASRVRGGVKLPEGTPRTLDVNMTHEVQSVSAYPNGCHVVEVEIDPDTGVVEIVKYSSVNDFGVLLNPLVVEGQVHGGVVQGIGQALYERTVYDDSGQFLTGSFLDYALPRASDVPFVHFVSHPAPATTNPLGVKGCGEAGCAGALPSVTNAVIDALSEYGVTHIDMPATPERVWNTIQAAKSGKAAHV